MLIVASKIAAPPRIVMVDVGGPLTCSMPPMTMMPLIALVTLINGVCSAGVTFQTTCQPTMQASANTVRCDRNAGGATKPSAISSAAAAAAKIPASAGLFSDGFGGGAGAGDGVAATGVGGGATRGGG